MISRRLDDRHVALGRAVGGLSMLARPQLLPALMGLDAPTRERIDWVVQMLGAREVALGVGALAHRSDPRPWRMAGAFSDAADALVVAAALSRGRVPKGRGAVVVAVAALASASQVAALLHR